MILIAVSFFSANAEAQNLQYEADPGLIFVGFLPVFYNSDAPLSYQTMTPQEVPDDATLLGEVVGESCQHGISVPIFYAFPSRFDISGAIGNGSYEKALQNIKVRYPEVDGVYDIKVDIHKRYWVLGVYRTDCTIVIAQGFKKKDSN